MATVRMDTAGMRRLQQHIDRIPERVAHDVADDARRYCPVDTGALRASIYVLGLPSAGLGQVWVGTDHWAPTEYGSRPHRITSHGNYPLRNRETGQVFGRSVWHPGTPEQPFMRPAIYQRRVIR